MPHSACTRRAEGEAAGRAAHHYDAVSQDQVYRDGGWQSDFLTAFVNLLPLSGV